MTTTPHPLDEPVAQADEIYQTLRAWVLAGNLTVSDVEDRLQLARLRELLNQSTGLIEGIERR